MYVIATVICPNFHFSVSPHVPFLNLLFEQIANSNEYLLAKFGFDTAERLFAVRVSSGAAAAWVLQEADAGTVEPVRPLVLGAGRAAAWQAAHTPARTPRAPLR